METIERHWAYSLIGMPWAPGAVGPRDYHCWGLVQRCAAQRLGSTLPPASMGQGSMTNLVGAAVQDGWRHVEGVEAKMQEDDIVLMIRLLDGQRHCGYAVRADDKLGVLHADGYLHPKRGPVGHVVFQTLEEATGSGYAQYQFWRHSK